MAVLSQLKVHGSRFLCVHAIFIHEVRLPARRIRIQHEVEVYLRQSSGQRPHPTLIYLLVRRRMVQDAARKGQRKTKTAERGSREAHSGIERCTSSWGGRCALNGWWGAQLWPSNMQSSTTWNLIASSTLRRRQRFATACIPKSSSVDQSKLIES